MADVAPPSERWQRLWELFHAALERDPSERPSFLERVSSSDRELRQEIEELLTAHEQGSNLLDQPACMLQPTGDGAEPDPATSDVADETDFAAGEILAGRFEVVRLLGRGGMGTIYEAHDRELDASVALKTLRPEIARDRRARERFRREISLARQVTHPNACRIFDLFHHGEEVLFLSMELLAGETLAERLQREGPLPPSEILLIVTQVAAALGAAHRVGVVHRDLKSSNVMLVPDEDGVRAVVTDFGLAITTHPGDPSQRHLTASGKLLGTPAFMAPEQLEGGESTPATDVHALGLMLYEMLTGELPFSGDSPLAIAAQRLQGEAPSPRTRVPDLERSWERTILRCLERDPAARFQSAAEVVAGLQGARIRATRAPWHLRAGLAAAAILLAVVATALWLWSNRTPVSASLAFEERDWVLISSFENGVGEQLLDGTLEAALGRELSNSRFVNVVPRDRVEDTLRLMKKPPGTRVDRALGQEICRRDEGIRALLTGRVERFGSNYALSAELVDPSQGVVVASLSETARGEHQVLLAVRRLSTRVRETLGEEISQIRSSDEKLQKVTTTSLRALQLFTQADAVVGLDPRLAEQLLTRAIAKDPEFASAYNQLAFAINNQEASGPDRPRRNEVLAHLEKALELSEQLPDRERYFIRATHSLFANQEEQMVANLEALLRLHPDHYSANHRMARHLTANLQLEESIPYSVRRAELRPDHFWGVFRAGHRLAIWGNRPADAEPFIERARALLPQPPERIQHGLDGFAWVLLYPTHKHWLRGDLDAYLRELERWSPTLESMRGTNREAFALNLVWAYSAIGQVERALAASLAHEDVHRAVLGSLALSRGDWASVAEHLREPFDEPGSNAARVDLLTRAGLLAEAWNVLAEVRAGPEGFDENILRVLRGGLLLAEGDTEGAVPLLQQALPLERIRASPYYFRTAASLAWVWERQGDVARALRMLEEASQQKARTYPASRGEWMRVQLQLADLYRTLGRHAKAQEIETELWNLLAYADPDFPLLSRLQASGDAVAAAR